MLNEGVAEVDIDLSIGSTFLFYLRVQKLMQHRVRMMRVGGHTVDSAVHYIPPGWVRDPVAPMHWFGELSFSFFHRLITVTRRMSCLNGSLLIRRPQRG